MTKRLLLTIFLSATTLFFIGIAPASAGDFDGEFQALIDQFEDSLEDATKAQALEDAAGELSDRIRQFRRDQRSELSKEELDRLRDMASEVRSLKSATRVVGQTHNAAYVSIESFDRIRDRLGLEPRVLQTHESGLELVRIDAGDFVSLLFRNPTKMNMTVMYSTNDPASPGGVGSAMCESYAVMSGLYNSRDREVEVVEFSIQAQEVRTKGCD